MKLIKKIEKVDSFHCDETLAYSINKILYAEYLDGPATEVAVLASPNSFKLFENTIYYQAESPGDVVKVEKNLHKKTIISASVYIGTALQNKSHIACNRKESGLSFLDLINKDSATIDFKINAPVGVKQLFLDKGFVFSIHKSIFYTDLNLKTLWTIDFNQGEELAGPMHTWGDILIYCTQITDDRFAPRYVQACSLSTGELLWREKGLTHYNQDPKTGMLYGLSGSLNCVDPKKGVIGDYPNTFKADTDLYISEHKVFFSDGLLYFSTNSHHEKPVQVGAYNIAARQVEFSQPLDIGVGRNASIEKPIVKDGKLYVLDSQKTLHIYAL